MSKKVSLKKTILLSSLCVVTAATAVAIPVSLTAASLNRVIQPIQNKSADSSKPTNQPTLIIDRLAAIRNTNQLMAEVILLNQPSLIIYRLAAIRNTNQLMAEVILLNMQLVQKVMMTQVHTKAMTE
nr:hypothetical protein [[Mycoplasma] imitans]